MTKNPNSDIFKYCPKCGSDKFEPNCIKSFQCNNCNFLFYLNSAAASAGLIFDNLNRLLVTVRKSDPGKGTFDLPGGFSDPDEKIEETIVREIKEELNLDIYDLKYFDSEPNHYFYNDVNYQTLDMIFLCKTKSFDNIIVNDDVADYKLIKISELDENLFGLSSIKNVIKKLKTNPPTF